MGDGLRLEITARICKLSETWGLYPRDRVSFKRLADNVKFRSCRSSYRRNFGRENNDRGGRDAASYVDWVEPCIYIALVWREFAIKEEQKHSSGLRY